MQIIHQLQPQLLSPFMPTIVTIGAYDGVHRGHKRLITDLIQSARVRNVLSAVITFHPRPKIVLGSIPLAADYLTTVEEKCLIFEQLGLDIAAVLPFTREFAQTPARDFIQQLVDTLHPLELWVGPDFKLGKDRQGDIRFLTQLGKELGFTVRVEDLQTANGEAVSSTRIRNALAEGNLPEVRRLLGHPLFLLGQVEHGMQRGRTIGFPTANITIKPEKLLPPFGVYAVWIHLEGQAYPAVANIGVRPTFNNRTPTVEVHIFDFNQTIYGKLARVDLITYLRPEQKFTGLAQLTRQIQLDLQQAATILDHQPPVFEFLSSASV